MALLLGCTENGLRTLLVRSLFRRSHALPSNRQANGARLRNPGRWCSRFRVGLGGQSRTGLAARKAWAWKQKRTSRRKTPRGSHEPSL